MLGRRSHILTLVSWLVCGACFISPPVWAQQQPGTGGGRLSGTVTHDENDDPYYNDKRRIRDEQHWLEMNLKPEFRAEPDAKLQEAEDKLMEYIDAHEAYKDAVADAQQARTKEEREETSRKMKEAGKKSTEARAAYQKAWQQYGQTKGKATSAQAAAERKEQRSGAKDPVGSGTDGTGGAGDMGTTNSGTPGGTGTGNTGGGGNNGSRSPGGNTVGGANTAGGNTGGGTNRGGTTGGANTGGATNRGGNTGGGGGNDGGGNDSGGNDGENSSPTDPRQNPTTQPRPQPGKQNPGSRTGGDENQADPSLAFLSGFLEGYNESLKADLTSNILTAPINVLGGRFKTVGKLLDIVGKAGAMEALWQDLNQPVDPNETPKERAKRIGKIFYDGLQVKDAIKSGTFARQGDIPGGPTHGGGNGDGPIAHVPETPDTPPAGGGGNPPGGNRPPPDGGDGKPPGGNPPPANGGGNGGAPGGPAPAPHQAYPGDGGPLEGTKPIHRPPVKGTVQPQDVNNYGHGQAIADENFVKPHTDPDGVWDQNVIRQPYQFTDPATNTKYAHTETLGDRLDDFAAGDVGQVAKELDLRGMTPEQVHNACMQRGALHRREGMPRTIDGAPVEHAHDIYVFPDGSMVRSKPQGVPNDLFRPEPHVSKSVLMVVPTTPGTWPDTGWENEAFKVTMDGHAVPKSVVPASGYRQVLTNEAEKNGYDDSLMGAAHTNYYPKGYPPP